ncbi:MAG: response regulator [Bacteroidota bacterium]
MSGITIVLIEDEPLIAKGLILSLEEKGYDVLGTTNNAKDGLQMIKSLKPDIALLDIQLKGDETGIWLAEQLQRTYSIPYIFLTSFRDKETMENAVKTMPYGYLIKPVDEDNLDVAIQIAFERFSKAAQEAEEDDSEFVINDAIFLKDDNYFVKLKFDDILLVKASGNYIEIIAPKKKHVLKSSLKYFTQLVPEKQFFQCHRSYVVNLQKVDKIGYKNLFINDIEVPIVKDQREDLLNRLQYYSK